MDECEIPLPEGDMDGENGEGDMADAAEGEPGNMFKAAAISMTAAAEAADRGEGIADPEDT